MKKISCGLTAPNNTKEDAFKWLKGVLVLCQLDDTFDEWEITENKHDDISDKTTYVFERKE